MRNIIVAGATGLVGSEVVRQLSARQDLHTVALVRRIGALNATPGIEERSFDYDAPAAYAALFSHQSSCDVLLIALGTTIRKAGSKTAFQLVDRDYPIRLATAAAKANPNVVIGVISSVGADRPTGFYLRTKAEMEAAIANIGAPCVFVRPSLLLGIRSERRPLEQLSGRILPQIFNVVERVGLGPAVAAYRPVPATQVASTLIAHAVDAKAVGIEAVNPVTGR